MLYKLKISNLAPIKDIVRDHKKFQIIRSQHLCFQTILLNKTGFIHAYIPKTLQIQPQNTHATTI